MKTAEHDIAVARQVKERAEVTVYFKSNYPDAAEILALRPCHPGFRQIDPATIRDKVGESGRLRILDLDGIEAYKLVRQLREAGFSASVLTNKIDRYVVFDRRTCRPLSDEKCARELTNLIQKAGLHQLE